MKRCIWLFIIMILFSSCSNQTEETSNNPAKIEIDSSIDSVFIEPGTIIDFTISEDGNKVEDDFTISVNQSELVEIRDDNSIKVLEDALSGTDIELQLEYLGAVFNVDYIVRDNLSSTVDEDSVITNPSDYDAIINKERLLASDYIPEDLIEVDVPTMQSNPDARKLRRKASDALTLLFEEAQSHGHALYAISGYRSYDRQDVIYTFNITNKGQTHANKFSAKPGASEHQSGLAMDISSEAVNFQLLESFGQTPEGIWVRENAHRFGFIIRYPEGKEEIVGYAYEPWHLRYLGIDLATKVFLYLLLHHNLKDS